MRTPIEYHPLHGAFNTVRLGLKPEDLLPIEERSQLGPSYPYAMAYLRIFIDRFEPSQNVPRGYMMAILDSLLLTLTQILSGATTVGRAEWQSDPWCLDLRGVLRDNRLYLTLHRSARMFAMEDVAVPLLLFADETVKIGHQWDNYLKHAYGDEIQRPEWDRQYLLFRSYLQFAEETLQRYKRSI